MFIGNKKCRIYAACGVSQTPNKDRKERKVKMELLTYMQMHWVEWLFTIITALIGVGYRGISKSL